MIIVWGQEGCTKCEEMFVSLKDQGLAVAYADMKDDLPTRNPHIRNEVMSAYVMQNAFPIVQVGDYAYTVEQYEELDNGNEGE